MAKQRHGTIKVNNVFNCCPSLVSPRGFFANALLCLTVILLPASAEAQNAGVQELLNRVDRFQRELSMLQRQVYKSEALPPLVAPLRTPAPGEPGQAARHSIRVAQLESELQKLTGRIEAIGFRTRQIEGRLEKLIADMDQRLTKLEDRIQSGAGLVSGSPKANIDLTLRPPAAVQQPPAASPQSVGTQMPFVSPGDAPRVLGTIPKNLAVSSPRGPVKVAPQPSTIQTAAARPAPVLPVGTPKEQYDYALSLMLKEQDFAQAESALRAFLSINPTDGLAENAYYWLGETFYVRKSYQDAAFAFAEGFQKFPIGNKAPDSLLKLGMSLDRLEKRREACTAYSRLLSTFPMAGARIKARVERERSRSKCR